MLLKSAMTAVLANNLKRPAEIIKKSPEEIKRVRDIENLTWAFSAIHLPTVDQMILDLPRYLKDRVFHFWESFRGVVGNSHFHLYDSQAADLIKDVYSGWGGCLGHGEQYRMAPNPDLYIFSNPGDAALTKTQQKAWDHINESRALLRSSLDQLLDYIRKEYIEIDIDELSGNAWREYVDFMRGGVRA